MTLKELLELPRGTLVYWEGTTTDDGVPHSEYHRVGRTFKGNKGKGILYSTKRTLIQDHPANFHKVIL